MIWGLTLLIGGNLGTTGRGTLAATMLQFYCSLIPFLLYKNENRHVEGTFYGITPASTLEKTLTVFVIATLLFPALTSVLMLSLDSLLASMPTDGGFSGHIWKNIFTTSGFADNLFNIDPSLEKRSSSTGCTTPLPPCSSTPTSACCSASPPSSSWPCSSAPTR